MSAALAAPSTGGAVSRMRSAPVSVTPSMPFRSARGAARMAKRTAPSVPVIESRVASVTQSKETGAETISASWPSGVAKKASQLPRRSAVRVSSTMSRSSRSRGFQSGQMKA